MRYCPLNVPPQLYDSCLPVSAPPHPFISSRSPDHSLNRSSLRRYLNGTNYLRFLRLKTGVVKVVGVIFSVSAGLIIGKEGPLIHIGSILAANYATLPGLGSQTHSQGAQAFSKVRST